jgi:hypothetical protein
MTQLLLLQAGKSDEILDLDLNGLRKNKVLGSTF